MNLTRDAYEQGTTRVRTGARGLVGDVFSAHDVTAGRWHDTADATADGDDGAPEGYRRSGIQCVISVTAAGFSALADSLASMPFVSSEYDPGRGEATVGVYDPDEDRYAHEIAARAQRKAAARAWRSLLAGLLMLGVCWAVWASYGGSEEGLTLSAARTLVYGAFWWLWSVTMGLFVG